MRYFSESIGTKYRYRSRSYFISVTFTFSGEYTYSGEFTFDTKYAFGQSKYAIRWALNAIIKVPVGP